MTYPPAASRPPARARGSVAREVGVLGAYAGLVFAAAWTASVLRPEGARTSLWWPAAGIAVAGALLLPAARRPAAVGLVAAVTTGSNLLTGRPPGLALWFGVVNAVAVAAVVALLVGGGRSAPRLDSVRALLRLYGAAAAGAAIAGLGAGAGIAVLGESPVVVTVRSVALSHLSAILLVTPLVLPRRRGRRDAGPLERAAVAGLLAAVLLLVYGPGHHLPLSFLPLVPLVWAAARACAATTLAALVATALAVVGATTAGWGPNVVSSDDPFTTFALVQAFIVVSTTLTLLLLALSEERRDALRAASELALTDTLTGLPNRRLLRDRMDMAARDARHSGGGFTLLLVDLDGFKRVNDTAGHDAGDEVLVEVARRLSAVVRPGDTVARLGGDEFTVVCPRLTAADAVEELVGRVRRAVLEPVVTAAGVFSVGVSIGVAVGDGSAAAGDVLRRADRDMYRHKQAGRAALGR